MSQIALSAAAQRRLLTWYRRERRDLPWRQTQDPYAIWVSEIMLQQSQVATVIPYYERWMARFPNVELLAASDESDVLACWQGLGYYRRSRYLHQGARHLIGKGLPRSADEWREIPGVGAYTAAAICSIAFQMPEPLVDGNVCRVYSRITADDSTPPTLVKHAWDWAKESFHSEAPGDWNQALMELGATVCSAGHPSCGKCPLEEECEGNRLGIARELPKVASKKPLIRLTHSAIISQCDGFLGVEQIPTGEWWEGMWRFPRTSESDSAAGYIGTISHTVTNHRIALEVFSKFVQDRQEGLRWLRMEDLDFIAMPSPQRKALALLQRTGPDLFRE